MITETERAIIEPILYAEWIAKDKKQLDYVLKRTGYTMKEEMRTIDGKKTLCVSFMPPKATPTPP